MNQESSLVIPQSLDAALWELSTSGMQSLSTPELSSCSTSSDDRSFYILSPDAHPSPMLDNGPLKKSAYFSSPEDSPTHPEFFIGHRSSHLSVVDHQYPFLSGPLAASPKALRVKPLPIPDTQPHLRPSSPRRQDRQLHKHRPPPLDLKNSWDSSDSSSPPSTAIDTPLKAPTLPEFARNPASGHPSNYIATTKSTKRKPPSLTNIATAAFFPTVDTESNLPETSETHSVGLGSAPKHHQLTSTSGTSTVSDIERNGVEGEPKDKLATVSVKRDQHEPRPPRLNLSSPIGISNKSHTRSRHPTHVRRSSTEALTSLAWTGEFPPAVSPSVYARSRIGDTSLPAFGIKSPALRSAWRSTWSLSEEADDEEDMDDEGDMDLGLTSPIAPVSSRSRFIRRDADMGRWTLGRAVTAEDISDEGLLSELEKLRTRNEMWGWRNNLASPLTSPLSPPPHSAKERDERDCRPTSPIGLKPSLPSLSDPALSATWQIARRALLTCRELVRTERHYLAHLHSLCSNGTQTPPPALMLTYLPALMQASQDLLTRMEANPSAQGVADAFVTEKHKLETALVGWSGVVGGFFVGTVGRARSASGVRDRSAKKEDTPGPLRKRVGSWKWKKGLHSISSLGANSSTHVPPVPPLERRKERTKEKSKPTVRDLAILPTQRVMRYILLYKDLSSYTSPGSAAQAIVGRAVEAAITIAQNCDRAQGNAAFLLQQA